MQDNDYDAIATVETHLAGLSKMNEAKSHMQELGYTPYFAEAQPHLHVPFRAAFSKQGSA